MKNKTIGSLILSSLVLFLLMNCRNDDEMGGENPNNNISVDVGSNCFNTRLNNFSIRKALLISDQEGHILGEGEIVNDSISNIEIIGGEDNMQLNLSMVEILEDPINNFNIYNVKSVINASLNDIVCNNNLGDFGFANVVIEGSGLRLEDFTNPNVSTSFSSENIGTTTMTIELQSPQEEFFTAFTKDGSDKPKWIWIEKIDSTFVDTLQFDELDWTLIPKTVSYPGVDRIQSIFIQAKKTMNSNQWHNVYSRHDGWGMIPENLYFPEDDFDWFKVHSRVQINETYFYSFYTDSYIHENEVVEAIDYSIANVDPDGIDLGSAESFDYFHIYMEHEDLNVSRTTIRWNIYGSTDQEIPIVLPKLSQSNIINSTLEHRGELEYQYSEMMKIEGLNGMEDFTKWILEESEEIDHKITKFYEGRYN